MGHLTCVCARVCIIGHLFCLDCTRNSFVCPTLFECLWSVWSRNCMFWDLYLWIFLTTFNFCFCETNNQCLYWHVGGFKIVLFLFFFYNVHVNACIPEFYQFGREGERVIGTQIKRDEQQKRIAVMGGSACGLHRYPVPQI